MSDQLSKDALKFLAWIRDHQHHIFDWLEDDDGSWMHVLRLIGHDASSDTPREAVKEAEAFFEPDPDYETTNRMYRPNAVGMAALEEAGL